MKVFTKKGIIQKIIILIIFVILFNFIVPNISLAIGDKDDKASEIFGRLFAPIKELLLGVTDAVIWGIQYIMLGQEQTFADFAQYKKKTHSKHGVHVSTSDQVQNIRIPEFNIAPDEIFSNNIPLLDVDFFNISGDGSKQIQLENGETITVDSSAAKLQPIISKWYYALRNLAIVALLSILVYIAIRIIISSTSEDKAKYKSRLMDWLVAMCLIFTIHYIMSFAVTLTEEITKAVNSMNEKYNYNIEIDEGDSGSYSYTIDGEAVEGNSKTVETNLMEKVRLDLQIMPNDYSETQKLLHNFGFIVIYMGLVMYTVLFLFRYFKRLIILAFLTIIAPLVVMTYPLDKIHDNKAQGFNTWLKEYIFNLLIQPVHLILYTVLIGTAIDFAGDNILYSLVAFGFILQAEKLMMKFFGFNKASTVSTTSAALGGALAMKGVNALTRKIGGTKKQPRGEKQENGESKKITQANRKPDKDINELMNSVFGGTRTSFDSGDSGQPQPNPTPITNPNQNQNPNPNPNPNPGGPNTPNPNHNPEEPSIPMPNINPEIPNFPMPDNDSEMENTTETDTDSEEPNAPMLDSDLQRNTEGRNNSQDVPNNNSQNFENEPENYNQNGANNGDVEETQSNNENDQGNYENNRDNLNGRRNYNNSNSNGYQTTTEGRERLENRGLDLSDLLDNLPNNDRRTLTMPQRVGRGIKYVGPKIIGGVAKGLIKGTLTAGLIGTGATIGLTAGLVSDDFSNVTKYTLAGTGATLIAGKGIANKASNIKNGISEEYNRFYEATHTSEEVHAREDKKSLNNKERVKKYQEEFNVSKVEARRIIREEAQRYREYGITDDDIIIKAMKTKEFGESRTLKQRTSKERILLAKMASQVEGKEDRYKRLKEGLKDRGVKNKDANKYLRTIRMFNNWI